MTETEKLYETTTVTKSAQEKFLIILVPCHMQFLGRYWFFDLLVLWFHSSLFLQLPLRRHFVVYYNVYVLYD